MIRLLCTVHNSFMYILQSIIQRHHIFMMDIYALEDMLIAELKDVKWHY